MDSVSAKAVGAAVIIRTARKRHRCVNAGLAERGARPDVTAVCAVHIERGDQYIQGDCDPYSAGGFGYERICLPCRKAGFA